MLQFLQKSKDSLTPPQQNAYNQLMGNYRMMLQHQQQLRVQHQQQQQQMMATHPQQQGFQQMVQPGAVAQGNVGVPMSQIQQPAQQIKPGTVTTKKILRFVCLTDTIVFFFVRSENDLQTMLSQTDKTTSLAENLLKQFGANIKEEVIDDAQRKVASSSPQNVAADSTTNSMSLQRTIKCEATSTSTRSPCDIKNEPVVKIEKLFETERKPRFTTQMDSKQIIETVK